MSEPEQRDYEELPHWAAVSFIVRCATRFLPHYQYDVAEPADQRVAVTLGIQLAQQCVAAGGKEPDSPLMLGSQFFDHHDLTVLGETLSGCVRAADNTRSEVGEMANYVLTMASLAAIAFEAACAPFGETERQSKSELAKSAKSAWQWALFANNEIGSHLTRDFETIREWAARSECLDTTPAPLSLFGQLWPDGVPERWPPTEFRFRPRARLIRTIGDKLISGPEAAVIELIKNSHDADAGIVRVSFVPSGAAPDSIVIEDDGHGMTWQDIESKWLEPATEHKRGKKMSPSGRTLLGSKGIGRFASARLGRYLELTSTAQLEQHPPPPAPYDGQIGMETTRIPRLDWNQFDDGGYLEDVRFRVERIRPHNSTGTLLKVTNLRDEWTQTSLEKLHEELRKLISPISTETDPPFRIYLDLSAFTIESSGFDGASILSASESDDDYSPNRVRPYPVLDASDYAVDGAFDERGEFRGTMQVQRGGLEPEEIRLSVPIHPELGEQPCGVTVVRLHIFDREAEAIRSTAREAGFGPIGVREARRILDQICGVTIYRAGFRVRPYGDGENDWLTLDAKRVQNPSLRIGRNQIAGTVLIDSEDESNLIERSSREGLEENGAFLRLTSLLTALLAKVVEPRRRQFRINAGIEKADTPNFQDVMRQVQMGWSKVLVAKLPESDRHEAEELIAKETNRLKAYLKKLEKRQAQLEANVTMGLIVGEVMHQGNTPLSFIETESARLNRWWPNLFTESVEAKEDRQEVPRLLNGMTASSSKLRTLFDALRPLSGARRGKPKHYEVQEVLEETQFLFESRMQSHNIMFKNEPNANSRDIAYGYKDDLATAATNLFDNSIYWLNYYNVKSPIIRTTVVAGIDSVNIRIEDNGHGIRANFAEQLFDVGFTLKPNGTGLGLSIAKEAILRSNGKIELLASNYGAVFEITLPTKPLGQKAKDVLKPE